MNDPLILLHTFGISLLLTLLFELPIALAFGLRRKDIILAVLVNILTNPAVVYCNLVLCRIFPLSPQLFWQLPLELAAVAAEGFCYSRCSQSIKHPWLLAAVANCFSYGCGLLINIIF